MKRPFTPPPIPNQDAEQLLFEDENEMTSEEFGAALGNLKALMDQRKAASTSPLMDWMRSRGIPLTRENYLRLEYPEGLPEPWTAELEAELPAEIRAF
jgi:hypothetical protein